MSVRLLGCLLVCVVASGCTLRQREQFSEAFTAFAWSDFEEAGVLAGALEGTGSATSTEPLLIRFYDTSPAVPHDDLGRVYAEAFLQDGESAASARARASTELRKRAASRGAHGVVGAQFRVVHKAVGPKSDRRRMPIRVEVRGTAVRLR